MGAPGHLAAKAPGVVEHHRPAALVGSVHGGVSYVVAMPGAHAQLR